MALSFERLNSNHVHGGGNDFCTEDQSPQRGFIPTTIDLQEGETCAGLEVDETLGNKEEVNGICIENIVPKVHRLILIPSLSWYILILMEEMC